MNDTFNRLADLVADNNKIMYIKIQFANGKIKAYDYEAFKEWLTRAIKCYMRQLE